MLSINIENKIQKTQTCWLWLGTKDRYGYGVVSFRPRVVLAHRVVFQALVRQLVSSEILHHTCKVRCCVNPDHLVVTTRKDHEDSPDVINKRKTCCIRGHEFTPENTYLYTSMRGWKRACKKCKAARNRTY